MILENFSCESWKSPGFLLVKVWEPCSFLLHVFNSILFYNSFVSFDLPD